MSLRKSNRYCHEYVLNLALTFTETAVQMSVTYRYLKKNLQFLLIDVILNSVRKNDDLIEQYVNDPVEYVRQQNDYSGDFKSESYAASCLLIDLAKFRGLDVLPPLMEYYSKFLQQYQALPEEQQDYRMKDAVYSCLGDLSENLLSKKTYRQSIEGLLVNFVFPDFRSKYGLLRCQACWLLQSFHKYNFSKPEYFKFVLNEMVNVYLYIIIVFI